MSKPSSSVALSLQESIYSSTSYGEGNQFNFLNLSTKFSGKIDWDYSELGKLWTYNLAYFEYLNQKDISKEYGLILIEDFIDNINSIKTGLEPFPISLRGINWIKFLSRNNINNEKINNSLYAQYYILYDNIEYHLLGNHLLENGFSFLFGAYYFKDEKLYEKACRILKNELEEQILGDGAHFELSPMYHQIMLSRLLDCINLLKNNSWHDNELLIFLNKKSQKMLSWINNISYKNGDIPLFNDSVEGIAPTTMQLNEYATNLQLRPDNLKIRECGYRKILKQNYELILDVGKIGPDYIPGHAHADTLSFELKLDGKPFIVDTGISTYESGSRRDIERGTVSHNTVVVNGKNSSEVWGGFRVAKRAKIINLMEDDNSISATHDGYKRFGIYHIRKFIFEDDKIIIKDDLEKDVEANAYLHFHPDIKEGEIMELINIKNAKFKIRNYSYAEGFNRLQPALMIKISFKSELRVEIKLD